LASEIARLQEDLARNPVAELINAGVYQSIVEDVESFDLPESYQTPLEKLVSPVKGRIPKKVDKVLAQVALRHDTTAYKILRDATQLSDFTARYVMHQHNVKVKKMDRTDSVNDIVKTFVNYDIPTHEGLDYANRMGLAMFTKYFLRIQQIVVALAVEHPSKILMLGFGELLFGAFSDITDSSVLSQGLLSHLQNPLDVLPGLETAFTTEFAKDAASYLLPSS
jgi:c-di-GMP-related signal transduction protein